MKKIINDNVKAFLSKNLGVMLIFNMIIGVALFMPNKIDRTDWYNFYNELKDYTNTYELEGFLNENEIRYKKELGDLYAYGDVTIQFITIDNQCKVVVPEWADAFEKIDKRENVKITKKDGEEYISCSNWDAEYLYSNGKYYSSSLMNLVTKIILSIILLFGNLLFIYAILQVRKRS